MRAVIIAAAVMAMGLGLSGCVAYEVASTAASVTGSVVGTVADAAGDVISAPFGHNGSDKKTSD